MVTPAAVQPILEADGLVFAYPEAAPLIRGVSLSVAPGEVAGLCGPNGSGKTTLLRLLSGRLRAGAGTVRLVGRAVSELSRPEVARLVGVVSQNGHVGFPFSALEVVLMGRAARSRKLFDTEADLIAAREAMELTETLDLAEAPFGHLSGGQRQRVLIARALAQTSGDGPRLLLLDEPAAFLDLKHQLGMCELLWRLAAERGLAVLAVWHDLDLAARFCHRLLLLHEGRLVAVGKPAEVLTPATLEAVFGVTVSVSPDPATGSLRVSPLGRGPVT